MELLRQTVRKFVFDYLLDSQECTLTLHYGFASLTNRASNVYEVCRYVLDFWAPKLQDCIGDTGTVGGVRGYAPYERHKGSAASLWKTPGTVNTIESAVPGLAVLIRGLQTDRPQRLQKRCYIPIRTEAHINAGLLTGHAATGAVLETFRLSLFARINIPTAGPPIQMVPCVPENFPDVDEMHVPSRYWSLQDAVVGSRPAQRRSRQLRGQFAYDGLDLVQNETQPSISFNPMPGELNHQAEPLNIFLPAIPGLPVAPEV